MKRISCAILIFPVFALYWSTAFGQPVETQPAQPLPVTTENQETDVQQEPTLAEKFEKVIQFNGKWQSIFVFKNDSDFDDTKPYYNPNGQTVGNLGTFFAPRLTITPDPALKIVWEMELGLNLWSRNDPDQYITGEASTFQFANRELYAEGHFVDDLVGFKAGYQYFSDPTGLFLGHWIGAASFISDAKWAKFTISVGQLPDQTYEGVTLDANNFNHDTFFYGFRIDIPACEWLFALGFYGLHDAQVIDQTLDLYTPSLRVSADYEWVDFGIDLAFQGGSADNAAINTDETTIAWAMQAFADFYAGGFSAHLNQLMLSADDEFDRNGTNHGFYYSGKSKSRTLLLTEDELRDRGGNLDEVTAEKQGKFYVTRPGLSVTDVTFSYNVADIFVPSLIVGMGFVLEKDNAMNSSMIGVETDLDLELRYKKLLSFHLTGGLLFAGGAGAALVNVYDHDATNMLMMTETSLAIHF